MEAPHSPTDLDLAKRAMRDVALAARAETVRAGPGPTACGSALAAHVLRDCPPPSGAVVSGFLPIGDEIDIQPLLVALHERGHILALPVTPKRGNPLTFRRWQPGDTLVAERFGTMRPVGDEIVPDFLLVPLLAFDRLGFRLGYGAGYYDRTLTNLSGHFALGCSYAAQYVDAVPIGPYDVRLDAVATELGILRPHE